MQFFSGYLVKFDNVNVYGIKPHKIPYTKNNTNLLVLHYDYYIENTSLYLIPNEKEPFVIDSMNKYVRQLLEMIYKIFCK